MATPSLQTAATIRGDAATNGSGRIPGKSSFSNCLFWLGDDDADDVVGGNDDNSMDAGSTSARESRSSIIGDLMIRLVAIACVGIVV